MQTQNHTRESILEILTITEGLPTLPDRFLRIQAVLNDPSSSLNDLTNIVETDQSTSAALVKIANSSHYNPLGKPVSNLNYAISRLGRDETSDIALSMSLLYGFSIPAGISFIRRFWAHAFAVGQVSRYLATAFPQHKLDVNTLFLAGLMHDIGRAILSISVDTHYFDNGLGRLAGKELTQAEEESYGINHAEVGEVVLKGWGFPPEIYKLVGAHHCDKTTSVAITVCTLANEVAKTYLGNITGIEDVESKLHDKLFEQIMEELQEAEHPLFMALSTDSRAQTPT